MHYCMVVVLMPRLTKYCKISQHVNNFLRLARVLKENNIKLILAVILHVMVVGKTIQKILKVFSWIAV